MRIREFSPLKFSLELLKLPWPIKTAALLMFVYCIGWGIAGPFIPIYFNQILGTYTAVGIVFGIYPLFCIVWDLIIGPLSDAASKKRIMTIALLLYLPMSFMILSLKKMSDFITFRVYHSFATTSLYTAHETYVRKHSPKRRTSEAVGLVDSAAVLASVIGAVIGGLLISKIGFNIFYAISIFAALAFIPLLYLKRRRKHFHFKIDLRTSLSNFFRSKELVKLSFINFFFVFCYTIVFIILPLILVELNATFLQIGLIYGAVYTPFLFQGYFSVLADKFGKKKVLMNGLLFGAILFLGMFFVKSILVLFALSLLLSVSFAAISPSLSGRMTELMPKKEIGGLTGIKTAVRDVAAAISPVLAGILADAIGLGYVFLMGFIVFFIMYFVVSRFRFEDEEKSENSEEE